MTSKRYGWRPSLFPGRIPALALDPSLPMPTLSSAKDLTVGGLFLPIWDQGQTGSCTGHGCARAIAYARAKQGLPVQMDPSRLFPYYNARVIEGTQASDAGATVSDIVAAATQLGDCPYADWPTDPSQVTVKPSDAAYTDALPHKTLSQTRVLGSTVASFEYHFKHCIDVLGFPPVFGFAVYESFESDQVAADGIVPMPAASEEMVGGHCVCAVGYDDATSRVKCANSWGESWGDHGYFYLPYAYIFDPNLATDFRALLVEAA